MLASTSLPVAAGPSSGSALRSALPTMASRAPSRHPLRRNAPATKATAFVRSTATTTAASHASAGRGRPLSSPPAAGYVGRGFLVSPTDENLHKEIAFRVHKRSPLIQLFEPPCLFFSLRRRAGRPRQREEASSFDLSSRSFFHFFSSKTFLFLLQLLLSFRQHVHRRTHRPRRHGPEPGPQRCREGLPYLGLQQVRGQDRRVRLTRHQGR